MLCEPGLLLLGTFFHTYKAGKVLNTLSPVFHSKLTAGDVKQELSEKPFNIYILLRLGFKHPQRHKKNLQEGNPWRLASLG